LLRRIGLNYHSQGQYAKALEFYQQSLAISKVIGDRRGEGTSLNNIGSIYSSVGQYTKALEFYQQALAISKAIGNQSGEVTSLNNIGLIYHEIRQYAKALEFYQQALAISKAIGNQSDESNSLNSIGGIYNNLGQYAKALEFYQQSLAISKAIGDQKGEGTTLTNIAVINDQIGKHAEALEFYQQALVIRKAMGDREGEVVTLNNIGANLWLSGRVKQAEEILFNAIEVFESLHFGLTDENKVSLLDTRVATYFGLQQVLIAQNKVESALEVAERGRARAFVELLATRINVTEKPLPQLTETLRPTISQIRQIAKERSSTLVQYSIVDDKVLYVWVVQPQGKVTHRKVDLPQQLSLSELVDTSREAIGVRGRGNFRIEMTNTNPSDRLKQLHQLLIEPIADLLPTDPNAPVIFVPYGELFLVPFPALQDATGKYLIEKHTILTAPAIQVLDLTRQKRQQVRQAGLRDVLIVGNPTMPKLEKPGETPEQLKALDGAEREATTIASLFKTKALTSQQASKAAIMPKLSQARIIHLATHGLLEDLKGLGTPGAIALAPSGTGEPNDGLLTANEILDLKLNAELVVLSACDTGRGKITSDSVIGLSRSLIIAGTPSVIVSLWSVPDAPTAELMTEFYRNWQEKKLDKAQALRQAMLTIMKRPNAKPRDWAAFTLIGEAE
jgi:CHAT domain-containing protein/Flp pilus assembly protein TadD